MSEYALLDRIEKVSEKTVLDATCGGRAFWFDKHDKRAVFIDRRNETLRLADRQQPYFIAPDVVADFTKIPFADDSFSLVVFDPPHIVRDAANGDMTKKYGFLCPDWRDTIRQGFVECVRVLRPLGTLIFKWSDVEIPLCDVLQLAPIKPLFGHRTSRSTHWVVFQK